MFKVILSSLIFLAGTAHAEDVLEGDTLIRRLSVSYSTLVFYKNPTGESGRTLVACLSNEQAAKESLSNSNGGGVMLVPNSTVVFKNDTSRSFTDGSNLKGQFIQIECK
ncbi:hypothetical protein AZI86_16090 [Bdellovibrio bacteriovorus]|uniref:Uncharacterized protein n=1 Tax=Bdellovibrio bacteriovorus TaxID=959 RepID=A0A150WHN0_BDEBC|nr:hypothetical protein [Bdellovibrio bacteriovorus]KYG63221.1 hypothetical protein AZI86_16090 [Bdellovibrio bacteriovorus]